PLSQSVFSLCAVPSELYTLSLHDALPISRVPSPGAAAGRIRVAEPVAGTRHRAVRIPTCCRREGWRTASPRLAARRGLPRGCGRSEEHTSELQSRENLVCRLLLEKKKTKQ